MRLPGNRGFAMVLVLWVVALLMAIIPVYVHSMRAESSATLNTADSTAAHALAAAGVEAAISEIAADFSFVASGEHGAVFIERTAEGLRPIPSGRKLLLEGGTISYRIEDERGKLNVNTAPRESLDALLRLTGVAVPERDVITDSIVDWRDENHEFHLNGAEDDYYGALATPYGAKDGPADFKEELLLVKGVTTAIFNGKEQGQYAGIKQHITVHGDGRLNLNSASKEALEAAYGRAIAAEIMFKREAERYITIPVNNGLVSSDTFSIESIGGYNGMEYRVEATVLRKPDKGIVVFSWRESGMAQ